MAKNTKKTNDPTNGVVTQTIEVPMCATQPDGYCTDHADVQLDRTQAATLKRLRVALDERGDRLANGRRVTSVADCVRYLLDQLDG